MGLIIENYLTEVVVRRFFRTKDVSHKSLENTYVGVSLIIKLQALGLQGLQLH